MIDPGLDVLVVANRHRPPLIVEHLGSWPHRVSFTPDYALEPDFTPAPSAVGLPVISQLGAFRAHMGHVDALKLAEGERILVFEDDAVPVAADWVECIDSAARLLDRHPAVSLHTRHMEGQYRALDHEGRTYWRLNPVRRRHRGKPSYRVRWGLGATMAYLITRSAALSLIEAPYDGLPIDLRLLHQLDPLILEPSPFEHDRRHGSLTENPR